MPGTLPEKHTQTHTCTAYKQEEMDATRGGHASCTQQTQTKEDQMQGQRVTQGSHGIKTFFKSHQEETKLLCK